MLKLLKDHLPEAKSAKRLVTLKNIEREEEEEESKEVYPKSLKKIGSSKNLQVVQALSPGVGRKLIPENK